MTPPKNNLKNKSRAEKHQEASSVPSKTSGVEGRKIRLRTNHFHVTLHMGAIFQYKVMISPATCTEQVKRHVTKTMISVYHHIFDQTKPVFDGNTNLYTWEALPIAKDKIALTVDVLMDGRIQHFKVSIHYVGNIKVESLKQDLQGGKSCLPENALRALNEILRQMHGKNYTLHGRILFRDPPVLAASIGGGLEVCQGHHQVMTPCHAKMTVNVDMATTVVYKAQSVLNFLKEVLEIRRLTKRTRPLDKRAIDIVRRKIKGTRIQTVVQGNQKLEYTICDISDLPASSQFTLYPLPSGRMMRSTVVTCCRKSYGYDVRFPNMPCVLVDPRELDMYLPIEICEIIEGQVYRGELTDQQNEAMNKVVQRSAPKTETMINQMMAESNYTNNPELTNRDIIIDSHMMEVSGHVLDAPKLMFGGKTGEVVEPKEGAWSPIGKEFYKTVNISEWAVVCFAPTQVIDSETLRTFTKLLMEVGMTCGLKFSGEPVYTGYGQKLEDVEPIFHHLKATFSHLQLVLVVLHGGGEIYREVKRLGDTRFGLVTQCVRPKQLTQRRRDIMANMCLQINTKIGGISHILMSRPDVLSKPFMIIGADTSHSTDRSTGLPSVAAAVASIDEHACRWVATVRTQTTFTEKISKFADMVQDLLLEYYQKNQLKPTKIIVFRDGVSESQFQEISTHEIQAIRQACAATEDEYRPPITFLIVQKTQSTRFFCMDIQDQTGPFRNVPPGTTVDEGVTSPITENYFQCSHFGKRGTSRPRHYHVILDECKIGIKELERLTYSLSHLVARSSSSLSLPSPIIYADLAASRGYLYLAEAQCKRREKTKGPLTKKEITQAMKLHPNVHEDMYFI